MRGSQTLIPKQKETPADAQIISHQLMLRAGLIRQLTAGVYDFLPAAVRSLQKAMEIVREEMNGDLMFGLKDQHGRGLVLAPTHEEVITELVGAYVNSYKQLPLSLYQI